MATKPSLSATAKKLAQASQADSASGPFAQPWRSAMRVATGTRIGRATIAVASTSPTSRAFSPLAATHTGMKGS